MVNQCGITLRGSLLQTPICYILGRKLSGTSQPFQVLQPTFKLSQIIFVLRQSPSGLSIYLDALK